MVLEKKLKDVFGGVPAQEVRGMITRQESKLISKYSSYLNFTVDDLIDFVVAINFA